MPAIVLMIVALAQCPTAAQMEGDVVWRVPKGCVVPLNAYLVSTELQNKTKARLAGLDSLVSSERASKEAAREERDRCIQTAQQEIDALRQTLRMVKSALHGCDDPPSRALWAGIGAGAGAFVCAGGAILGATIGR